MAEIDDQKLKEFLDDLKRIVNDRSALKKKADELVASKKNIDAINKRTAELKKAAGADKDAKDAVEKFTSEVKDSTKEHKDFLEKTKSLKSAFMGLGSAMERGEGTISSFTDNFKGLGVIGDSLGFLGNRLDTNIETFRQLSQIGATFGQSIVELRQTAATAALPLDDFAALVRDNSQSLAALFGSTTQGAKGIALLGDAVRTQGIDRLAPLGFTVDEVNETLLLNLERQRRTNMFSRMTDQQRTASAIRFAEELDRLARLTGAQRNELRAQIEQQQSNAKFQAFLQNATDGARSRLEGFAATIGTIAPGLNEGFQDLIANAGAPVTEASLALVQNIPGARDVVTDLISGVTTSEQALSRLRDLSANSVDRFRKATVTGQVEFLALQGDVINLARRITDVDSIFGEQGETADRLTQGLTTFEDASKRIAGQFQQIETGLLAGFGPALGGLSQATQFLMKGVGGLVAGVAQIPALTGTALVGILAGKFLLDKAGQTAVVFTGTLGALKAAGVGSGGMLGNLFGSKGGKRAAGAARFGATRLLPGLGAAIGVGSSAGQLMNKDKSDDAAGIGGLVGAGLGGLLGLIGGPGGALLGAGLGSMAGQYVGGMFGGERAFGGGMDAGKTYLTGERGPELITAGTKSTVTANQDLQKTFDTSALETKMATMTTELNNANKALANMVNGVNTLVAVESRALKAVERTARKDPNQIGIV
jgi:hypothetical protein